MAAEAGVSLRLVQYCFDTKAGLERATLERQSTNRWADRLADASSTAARTFVETFLAEPLPTDDRSRTCHLLWTSYAVLAMTDRTLADQPFIDGPNRRERELADVLRSAREWADRSRPTATRDPAA